MMIAAVPCDEEPFVADVAAVVAVDADEFDWFEGVPAFDGFERSLLLGEGRSWYPAAVLFLRAEREREVVRGAFPTPVLTAVDLDLLPARSWLPVSLLDSERPSLPRAGFEEVGGDRFEVAGEKGSIDATPLAVGRGDSLLLLLPLPPLRWWLPLLVRLSEGKKSTADKAELAVLLEARGGESGK